MRNENYALAEAPISVTPNPSEEYQYADGQYTSVTSFGSISTTDNDVAGAPPILDTDSQKELIPSEVSLSEVALAKDSTPSCPRVDLSDLDAQIDDIFSCDKDEEEKILQLLKISDRLIIAITNATVAGNIARYELGYCLDRIKNCKRGLLKKVKQAFASRSQSEGNGKTTLHKAHTYYLIPNVLKYLAYSYEKVLCLYIEAKHLFKDSSDPISDFLKCAGTSIDEVDLQHTSLKTIKKAIALTRYQTQTGYSISYDTALRLVKADKGVLSSHDLWDEIESYTMEADDWNEAINNLTRDKEEARKSKTLSQTLPIMDSTKKGDSTEKRDRAQPSPEVTEAAKSINVDNVSTPSPKEETEAPIQQAKEGTPVTPPAMKHPREVIMELDLSNLFDWVTERIRAEKKRSAVKGSKYLEKLRKLTVMIFEYQDAVKRATAFQH